MQKINAYTLMEVTIAMLLSAICITICYTAYGIIGNYYQHFQLKNETSASLLSLKHALEKDFLKSRYVLKTSDGLALQQEGITVLYTFRDQDILREVPEIHTDTFKVKYSGLGFFFEQREALGKDTVDRLELKITLDKEAEAKLRMDKKYSAENLFN